jgi:hypothetical protein
VIAKLAAVVVPALLLAACSGAPDATDPTGSSASALTGATASAIPTVRIGSGSASCAGTLLAPRWVVTSGDCAVNWSTAGLPRVTYTPSAGVSSAAAAVSVFYSSGVALLGLGTPITASAYPSLTSQPLGSGWQVTCAGLATDGTTPSFLPVQTTGTTVPTVAPSQYIVDLNAWPQITDQGAGCFSGGTLVGVQTALSPASAMFVLQASSVADFVNAHVGTTPVPPPPPSGCPMHWHACGDGTCVPAGRLCM